uniref:INTS8 TPR repeats domain-containing protein n=1 Tax=Romanomermis culicivorax TaxID=13658 RepID=A0A915IHR1_ROMCU
SGGINENFLKQVLDVILTNGLLLNTSNASLLRTMADLNLCAEEFTSAMQYYMQSYAVVTDFFTKSSIVSPIVDDKMITNMIKCCGKLNFHTIEALLSQLSDKPNYRAAVKALQESITLDGGDIWYPMIWDIVLLETFISNSYPNNDYLLQARLDEAFRLIGQQELNCHNSLDVLSSMEHRRKSDFLCAVCAVFFD